MATSKLVSNVIEITWESIQITNCDSPVTIDMETGTINVINKNVSQTYFKRK